MLGFPPRPTTILPLANEINPDEWLIQPKYRGWRIVIHKNNCYTRKGNPINIKVDFPELTFDYQLDGEIISKEKQTEHYVRRAIKNSTWSLKIFDIYIPDKPTLILTDRLKVLNKYFEIDVKSIPFKKADEIFSIMLKMKQEGYEGIVLKRKNGIYKISRLGEIVDNEWVKLK